jgi:tetratricopeptide (TPR) repeat protein
MTPHEKRLRLDLAAARYLEALEQDDFDAMADLWREAGSDRDLEAVLHQVHAALVEERQERQPCLARGEQAMNEADDVNRTVDDFPLPADSLDAGLAAAFGKSAEAPRSSLDASGRPVLLPQGDPLGTTDHVPDPEATGDHVRRPGSTVDSRPAAPLAAEASASDLPALPGYRVLREIARGGMGRVLAAHDLALERDVALKVLLPGAAADRFVRESKITARLPHPGIPPVHALGTLADGSPFLAMKLVAGQTLAVEMRTADRPRLLQAFAQVCQAVGFAHSRGVIHRDLKPANVMVGAFGEVQVMDWGLAKDLASREREQPEELVLDADAPGSPEDAAQTQAGQVMGTPAYMAPEQARGEASDARADVFALGGILCAILTGQAPFRGKSMREVIQRAGAADLAEAQARLECCGADAELVTLCRRCLSPNPADRPADGQAVADGLTAYLDGVQERLRQAELAEAAARARAAEEAKRRRLALALAATVLLALTLGGGAWLWLKTERDVRTAQVAREVNDALNRATALREKARVATVGSTAFFARAREQAQRALALAENGPAEETLKEQVRNLQAELDEERKDRRLLTALEEAFLAQAETLSENRFASERAVPKFREALRAYGMPAGEGEPAAVAARIRQRPSPVREGLLAALDEWNYIAAHPSRVVSEPHQDWLRAVLVAAEPQDGWSRRFRAAREKKGTKERQKALERLAARSDVREVPAPSLTRLARQLQSAGSVEAAARLLRRAQRRHPADFWINHDLGKTLQKVSPPQREEAARFLTAAVALRPESPGARINLGMALSRKRQWDEAIACFHKAIALDPKYVVAHNNLGMALSRKRQWDEAIACFRKAIALDPKYAVAHSNLGAALNGKRQWDEAIACCKKGIALDPKFADAHTNLGGALYDKGKVDAAIACFQKAITLDQNDAEAHSNLGNALRRKGQVEQAIACYKKAIDLDPMLAGAHNNMGVALAGKGKVDAAIACYQKAILLDPKYAEAHSNLGNALRRKGKADAAIACCQKAIALDPALAGAHSNLGAILCDVKHDYDAAVTCFRKAIALDPKAAIAHSNLGNALSRQGKVDEAIACWRKAIALGPKDAGTHTKLGHALDGKGKVDEAIKCYRNAIAAEPKCAPAHNNLGILLHGKGQVDEAIECFQKVIAFDPKTAGAHYNLGNALSDKGKVDEAIACYHEFLALHPKYAMAHCNLGLALLRKGQLDEAIACFKKAIALDPKIVAAHYGLGAALYSKGQLDEAILCFKKAIEIDPKYAYAHDVLGQAFLAEGRYTLARDALARALALLPENHPSRARATRQLQECRRCLKLEKRLPGLLAGKDKPASARERWDLAQICARKKLNAATARFFAQTFAVAPRLAEDLQAGPRYTAARHAALAAAGQGEDATKLDAKARARLRQQALDWLRADLSAWGKLLASGPPQARPAIVAKLSGWKEDSALAGIRDAAALARLPADEQKACAKLWADVAALRKKANAKLGVFLQERLPKARKALAKDSPQLAGLLAQIGMALLEQEQWARAAPFLRECLAIRTKKEPKDWRTFNTRSMLGGALLGQKKVVAAGTLLLEGYRGMKERAKSIPPEGKDRLREAVERLVQLYQATGEKDQAAKWRTVLQKLQPAAKPAKKP